MLRLLKFGLIVAVLGFLGVLGYAYLGDLAPAQQDVSEPVTLDGQ